MPKKVILLTGSSGDIGNSIAELYSKDDYKVICIDKVFKRSKHIKNSCYIECDLNKFVNVKDYKDKVIKEINSVIPNDIEKLILINNAAIQNLGPVDDLQLDDWNLSLSINAAAPFFLVQAFLKSLIENNGHVINISSIHAKLSKANFTFYAASKSALESITRSLATELSSRGVIFNAISPAAINTSMLQSSFSNSNKAIEDLKKFHTTKTIGSPTQLAQLVKAITDLDCKFLSGSVIDFSGGIINVLHDPDA